jgi:hypothetical protein
MLFFRLLYLRRRWHDNNDERALNMSYYAEARTNGAHALAEAYYADAQRHTMHMDRAAAKMLELGAAPDMTAWELAAVAWRRLPRWTQHTLSILGLLAVALLACVNDWGM